MHDNVDVDLDDWHSSFLVLEVGTTEGLHGVHSVKFAT
jgi:hypothetical protein